MVKVEDLTEELKEEKQKVLTLEEHLNTATLSLLALREVQLIISVTLILHFIMLKSISYTNICTSGSGESFRSGGGEEPFKEEL